MKRYDLELTATGPVMEERKEGAFVPFAEVEQLQAKVYGREGLPCTHCGAPIKLMKQGQRSTFYCARCQKEAKAL